MRGKNEAKRLRVEVTRLQGLLDQALEREQRLANMIVSISRNREFALFAEDFINKEFDAALRPRP